MKWLELVEREKPVLDVDQYLNYVSRLPLFINMASAAICMGFSAIFHLFFVYSPNASSLLARLDYAGITILIFGSAMPATNYLYACNEVARKLTN